MIVPAVLVVPSQSDDAPDGTAGGSSEHTSKVKQISWWYNDIL